MADLNKLLTPLFLDEKEIRKIIELMFFSYRDFTSGPDKILEKINRKFEGRVLSINLKDSEKGLFGWVYDIMIIDVNNKVKQVRVDAGTSTVLSVISGE